MITKPDALVRVRPQLDALLALAPVARTLPKTGARRHSVQSGMHASRIKGRGMEFDETRIYQAGDDIRHLDWKVTARTGQAHTKLFREERERPVFLSIDYRSPMWFATRGVFKIVQASRLAALLAWQTHFHGDRVGAQCFNETNLWEMPPRHDKHGPLRLFDALSRLQPPADVPAFASMISPSPSSASWGRIDSASAAKPERSNDKNHSIDLVTALRRLRQHARPGSLIYLLSDFRDLEPARDAITQLARHADVVLVWIYDCLERQLPQRGIYTLSDGRRRMRIDCADPRAHSHIAARFAARENTLRYLARRPGIHLLSAPTDNEAARLLRDLRYER